MKFWRTAEIIGSIALLACVSGIVLLELTRPLLISAFQEIESHNVDAFLSGRTNTFKGFDSARLPLY
ncbi:MAG: hypothetical protein C0469_01365 [Cyanobacteria bacterium DS2.3.42]|nr:hypothetical protein [Cyanobacteria bacterium DS2.3.42]